jgi:peptidyl-prolyl isomerase G (cyclophilin G)
MSKKKNPLVFLDVSIDGDPAERIFIEVMHFLNLLYW